MLAQSYLTPMHSLPVPVEMRGTPRAIFFLLRCIQPRPQPVHAPGPQRAPPALLIDADTFVFQF